MLDRAPVGCYVALGANLGDAAAALKAAVAHLTRLPECQLLGCSSLYRSPPFQTSGPDYVNAVAHLNTGLSAPQLLDALLAVERHFGRERSPTERYAPRTIDLDLLLYGSAQISSSQLTVPHPRLTERAFVVRPLAELNPAQAIPGLGTVSDWLPAVADQPIRRIEE